MSESRRPGEEPSQCIVAAYSVDPPPLSFFHAFDPDSFLLISAINDALVYVDLDGEIAPSLATSWEQTSPTSWVFELRQGVTFHNGEPFEAASVVATFAAHLRGAMSPTGASVFSSIESVTALTPHRVRFDLKFPNALFLRSMMFSSIYPARVLRADGPDAFAERPIGTGAYRMASWTKGHEIVLERNPEHWASRATVDRLVFPIVRQSSWVDYLRRGAIDMALNIDAQDAQRLEEEPNVEVLCAPAAMNQWFPLGTKGPLADVRVRQAINHAIHRALIVEVAEHGRGRPSPGLSTPECFGHPDDLHPYTYDPELARRLLEEAGYAEGITLRGMVSEGSYTVFAAVAEFCRRVGIELEAEVVPRPTFLLRLVAPQLLGEERFEGDFSIAAIDNPMLDAIFPVAMCHTSQGAFALGVIPEFEQQVVATLTGATGADPEEARRELMREAARQAVGVATVQSYVYAAVRPGFSVPLPRSSHFNTVGIWDLVAPARVERPDAISMPPTPSPELGQLIEGTSHTGTFYLPPTVKFQEGNIRRVWRNVSEFEARRRTQLQPMMRTLVEQAEAKNHLSNVMRSTERAAIVGYSRNGRELFVNEGYRRMVRDGRPVFDLIDEGPDNPSSAHIKAQVDDEGSWLGVVHLAPDCRHPDTPSTLHLAVTSAADEQGAPMGYTFVLSDFSGAEERIKSQAIRTILDHVPYGLLMIDSTLKVLEGYSAACDDFFVKKGAAIEGGLLVELLGLSERDAGHLATTLEQVFDDFLPEEVTLGQIPTRIASGDRWFSLGAAVIRDDDGDIGKLLVSLIDITQLIEAERQTARMRGVIKVLEHKGRFGDFVRGFGDRLRELASTDARVDWEQVVRRELHTGKGVFAQFDLRELAAHIHRVEDEPNLTPAHLLEVRSRVERVLADNVATWGLRLDEEDDHIVVSRSALEALVDTVRHAPSLSDARAALERALVSIQEQSFSELAGPVGAACEQQARRRGKELDFVLHGGDVTVPRQFEPVIGSLSHLIRNAVDHGVEPPGERGDKPARATVKVTVSRQGGRFSVYVEDDGRGIDEERLVKKAVENKCIQAAEAVRMSRAERLALVFRDALSTAEQVTSTSGRGVGMAAVRSAVDDAGGWLEIESQPGQGTRFGLHFDDHGGPMRSLNPAAE